MFIRIILLAILVYLVIRLFRTGSNTKSNSSTVNKKGDGGRKVSKDVGEYVDYEEMDD